MRSATDTHTRPTPHSNLLNLFYQKLLLDRMRHAIHPTKDDLQRAKSRNGWFSFPVHAQKIFLCTLCNFVTDRLQKSCFIGLTVNVRSRCEQTAIRSHSPFPLFFVFLFFVFLFFVFCFLFFCFFVFCFVWFVRFQRLNRCPRRNEFCR